MDIAVDTSVVMAVILNEPSKDSLIALTRNAVLVSAPSLPWEIGNALTALFKRGRLDLDQARGAMDSFEQIPVRLAETSIPNAISIAWEYGIYAHDAYILECARRLTLPLLTLDRPQRHVARELRIEVLEARP